MTKNRADILSKEGIARHLSSEVGVAVEVFDSLPSTNALLKQRAAQGAPEGAVIVADTQTAGRGRLGHSFFSPPDTGLYLSVLLHPYQTAAQTAHITIAASVAMCRALQEVTGISAQIKWVNDLFYRGKKIGGILTESVLDTETNRVTSAVLGVGVNVYRPQGDFPAELTEAGCVLESPQNGLRCRLAAAFLRHFWEWYRSDSFEGILAEYRRRCLVIGQRIIVCSKEETEALALDVDTDGRLLVRFDDGREAALSSGEIRIKIKNTI